MSQSNKIPVFQAIQVFEHQRLKVGDQIGTVVFRQPDFEAMCRFAVRFGEKYFRISHRAIQFRHYVGVIQIGTLTIEILPKADKETAQEDKKKWQGVLLEMLKFCRLLKPEKSSVAGLGLQRHMLFDLYIELFIEEVERLLRLGLIRQYQRGQYSKKALQGKLIFRQQLRKNLVHQERFFCEHDVYTFAHTLNLLIGEALHIVKKFVLPVQLQIRLNKIIAFFPTINDMRRVVASKRDWDSLRFNRKTERYRVAIDFAYLILLNYSPDIRQGKHPLLALLFDMNLLFEEYLYRRLVLEKQEGVKIRRQLRASFWHRSTLQPDIVISYEGKRVVLDTKWKVLKNARPAISDLRQMYVYSQYFGAGKTILLYPRVDDEISDLPPIPFSPTDDNSKEITCQVCFVPIIKDGRLNYNIGKELLENVILDRENDA